MFTGIIESTGKILEKTKETITLSRPEIFETLFIGQSIAVNGACLSVTQFSEKSISFDVMSETFRRTNLGEATTVNLERAMSAQGRFEGHMVLGHVDGKAQLIAREKESSGEKFIFSFEKGSENLENFCIEKGSICINGVSLTIGKIKEISGDEDSSTSTKNIQFEIFCIPLTLQKTNLGNLEISDILNIEADYFAKIVQKNMYQKK